jgi:serine/threonine-protein kinase HipA
MLVNPGSSLGGTRPKASVLDDNKNLWIAKFPGKTDMKDTGGWEKVANELARNAGINVAHSMIQKFSNWGANVENDLKELWRRIVFNLFISNTDDHLRNHGFILTEKGWILSPAFDINTNEDGSGLALNISLDDNSLDLDLPLEVVEYFRLNKKSGLEIIERIRKSVSSWPNFANKYRLPKSEQVIMARALNRFL